MTAAAKRAFKTELYGQFARIGKALSSGSRLELLELLAQGERTVEELAGQTGMSIANVSQHLQVLRAAQLVNVRRAGLFANYRLANESALRLCLSFREFGETNLLEVDRLVHTFFKDRNTLQAITASELERRLGTGAVTVVDVRPEEEFTAGHISGARSIPIAELEKRLKELPKRKTIVAYCRGPYCVFADDAVRLLRARGYKAMRLELGFPEWKLSGLPIAAAPHGG